MCNCSINSSQREANERENMYASRVIMAVLGVLLLAGLITGWATNDYGHSIYGAFLAWIPAVLIVGPICDKLRAKRSVAN